MKKTLLVSIVLFLFLCMTSIASASLITDTVNFGVKQTFPDPTDLITYDGAAAAHLEYRGDKVVWKHQFTYDPILYAIDSAVLQLYLYDDETDRRRRMTREYGKVRQSGQWTFLGEIDDGVYAGFDVSLTGLEDGDLRVNLVSAGGDFYIDKSLLEITYFAKQVKSVSEPGSFILLGIGLLGLAGYSRRRFKKS